jgi:hypothetical protein
MFRIAIVFFDSHVADFHHWHVLTSVAIPEFYNEYGRRANHMVIVDDSSITSLEQLYYLTSIIIYEWSSTECKKTVYSYTEMEHSFYQSFLPSPYAPISVDSPHYEHCLCDALTHTQMASVKHCIDYALSTNSLDQLDSLSLMMDNLTL